MTELIDRILIVGDSFLESSTKEELKKIFSQKSLEIQYFDSVDTNIETILSSRKSYDFGDSCPSNINIFVTTHNTDFDQQLAVALIQDFEFLYKRSKENSLFHDNIHINHLLWKELQTCLINWNIDSIVFLHFPQNLQEAILYQIATELKKETIVFNQSVFVNRYLSCRSILDYGNILLDFSVEKQTLSPRTKKLTIEGRSSRSVPCPSISMKGILQIFTYLMKIMSLKAFDPFFIMKVAKHIHDAPSNISNWDDPFSRFFNRNSYAYLQFLAHAENETADIQQRYIFFPLQSQKELISEILINQYSDQLLAIENLAKISPSDCKIFVKGSSTSCLDAITPMFFHRIKRMSNVVYLPSCTNVDDLICHSEFVATINSSLGWEALCKGKRVLTFGRPWYRNLPGVHTYKDGINIDEILEMTFNQNDLEAQVNLLYSMAHVGCLDQTSNSEHTKLPPDINATYIAQTILDLVRGKINATFLNSTTSQDENKN